MATNYLRKLAENVNTMDALNQSLAKYPVIFAALEGNEIALSEVKAAEKRAKADVAYLAQQIEYNLGKCAQEDKTVRDMILAKASEVDLDAK